MSPLKRYVCGIESPLTPPNLVSGLPLSHTPMPHINMHLAVLAEERAKRGRFSDAAELCTTIDHAPIQSLQEYTISSIITSSTAAKRPYITTSFLGPHSSQRRCSHVRLRYGAAELGRLASR